MEASEEELKEYHDLYNRLENNIRRDILAYIYESSKNYTELIEYTGLKPGSLYHHLNVLEPLIEKESHGLYSITKLGEKIAENLNLVTKSKPSVQIQQDSIQEDDILSEMDAEPSLNIDLLQILQDNLWFGWPNYILIGITVIITVILAFQGIALAGSAIYVIGNPIALGFDVFSFVLGLLILYIVETMISEYEISNRLKFSLMIRLLSMLPATIVGFSLLLLFLGGITPAPVAYPWIFAITVLLGYFIMLNGLHYLRGLSKDQSAYLAAGPIGLDLLIGVIVLITV